jgi:protein-L-isoaspartate(D-aspartate) O-methyltransferase
MVDFDCERNRLVDDLKRRGYVTSKLVEDAMRRVPREEFLPVELREEAYIDSPLPIGEGQTISAPHMVAIMAENLDLKPGLKILEVGTGSGYHAAICADVIAPNGHIYSMERITSLASSAEDNLKRTGYARLVTVILGDGSKGLPDHAPYDRIFVAAGAPDVPSPLTAQLANGGKLLVPVGSRWYQDLIRVTRKGAKLEKENLGGCIFVPLVGEYGH